MPYGPTDGATTIWERDNTTVPKPASSGLSSIMGLAGMIPGPVGAVANIASQVGNIASMFAPDRKKQQAASLQQAIEKTALQIQDAVTAGQIDVGAAMQQLRALQVQAAGIGGSPELTSAGQRANLIITQVLGNIQSKNTANLNANFTPGANPTNFSGSSTLGGDTQFQKDRLGAGVRNYAAGTDVGKQFLEASPVLQAATAHTKSPFDRMGEARSTLDSAAPQVDTSVLRRPLAPEKRY